MREQINVRSVVNANLGTLFPAVGTLLVCVLGRRTYTGLVSLPLSPSGWGQRERERERERERSGHVGYSANHRLSLVAAFRQRHLCLFLSLSFSPTPPLSLSLSLSPLCPLRNDQKAGCAKEERSRAAATDFLLRPAGFSIRLQPQKWPTELPARLMSFKKPMVHRHILPAAFLPSLPLLLSPFPLPVRPSA